MICKECQEEVDELVTIQFGRRKLRVCEDCADLKREEMELAQEAEGAMQGMMEYKGR